jgi:putative endonuclease
MLHQAGTGQSDARPPHSKELALLQIHMDTSTAKTSADESVRVSEQLELGRRGEELAAAYLQQAGYRIVAGNFVVPVGRNRVGAVINVEIDLVAYDGETLCFIEVKTRQSGWFAPPEVNVDRRKQRQVARAARAYRRMFGLFDAPYRYDVITVVLPKHDEPSVESERTVGFDINLLRNYWTEDQLRKRIWSERYWD